MKTQDQTQTEHRFGVHALTGSKGSSMVDAGLSLLVMTVLGLGVWLLINAHLS